MKRVVANSRGVLVDRYMLAAGGTFLILKTQMMWLINNGDLVLSVCVV